MDLAVREKSDVRVFAQIGADQRLQVLGPSESWRVDDALHAAGAGAGDVELHIHDFAVLRAFHRG
jgi:ribosomal protein S18 acetylase RimI-like enzyme